MTKEDFMREAISLSCESVRQGGGPFGAVIVKDGKIESAYVCARCLKSDKVERA